MILQYSNSIWACYMSNLKIDSVNSSSRKVVKLNQGNLAKLQMIRDHNQTIYFAEADTSKFTIVEISLSKSNLVRRDIYHVQGCKILALEIDHENRPEIKQEDNDDSQN